MKTPEEVIDHAAEWRFGETKPQFGCEVKTALSAAGYEIREKAPEGYVTVPREVLRPFLAFANANSRALQMLPDVQMTKGSPMAGPQLYGRHFSTLAAAAETKETRIPEVRRIAEADDGALEGDL